MWYFKTIEPGTPERNPRETEFFRLTNPSEAVIREFIQNSLDAGKHNENIEVKISLGTVSIRNVTNYLDNTLKKHLIACGFLDNNDYPEDVPYLVLEDFGTTGLDGPFDPDSGHGNFYNFWWREGISEKVGRHAGRWGLGKTTFHIVSRIRTFLGLTVRDDGKALLMGKALLKTHRIDNDRFQYFGYFSTKNSMPIEDDELISDFKSSFRLTRDNKTGLSVVIPFPDHGINFESMLNAVIQHYFFPILIGTLKVTISDNGRNETIDANNLIDKASRIDWEGTEWEERDIGEFLRFISTAIQSSNIIQLQITNMEHPEITPQSFGDALDTVKNSFMNGEVLKFQVPLRIRKNDGLTRETSFIILMKRFPNFGKTLEYYIRSGIIVTEHKTLGNRPVAALLIAEDEPICEFLGDCETPAHTNWNERTEGFKEKYRNAIRILRFIKKSVLQIVSILDEPPYERQMDFLKEIFSIPIEKIEEERPEEAITTTAPTVSVNRRKIPLFNLTKVKGGFKVTLNPKKETVLFPIRATIRIAYDTRRGNPFRQYDKFDFDIGSSTTPITIKYRDCNILNKNLNTLKVEITGGDFDLEVCGFDPHRDLVVNITEDHEAEV